MLGSIDANRGDYQNGWDTDQFPIDQYELVQAWMEIIRNGGFGTGGTNFDAKTRRNSTDLEDIIIAHVSGMDAMARALESASKLLKESDYLKMKAKRYESFDSGLGKLFEERKLSLEDVYQYGKKVNEPKLTSGKQELYEAMIALYAYEDEDDIDEEESTITTNSQKVKPVKDHPSKFCCFPIRTKNKAQKR